MYKTHRDVLTKLRTIKSLKSTVANSTSEQHATAKRRGNPTAAATGTMATPNNDNATNETTRTTEMTTETTHDEDTRRGGGDSGERSGGDTTREGEMTEKDRNDRLAGGGLPGDDGDASPHEDEEKVAENETGEEDDNMVEVDENGRRTYNFRKEEGTHGPVFWRKTNKGHWIFKEDGYYKTNKGQNEILTLEVKQQRGRETKEEEWGVIDMTDGEPIDSTKRTVRGKEGIDEDGWWQEEDGPNNTGGHFHKEQLTKKQVERIRNKHQQGE